MQSATAKVTAKLCEHLNIPDVKQTQTPTIKASFTNDKVFKRKFFDYEDKQDKQEANEIETMDDCEKNLNSLKNR